MEDHGYVPLGAEMAAAVVNKALIVNVRATAHDHPRHPSHGRQRGSEEMEDHGHVPPGSKMAAAVVNKVVIVNVRATAHDHLRDHPRHLSHGRQTGSKEMEDHEHVPPGAEMAVAVVNKAVIVDVRATTHDHLRDHSCHPPNRRQKANQKEQIFQDQVRDHSCHLPHGRQRGSEQEKDHGQARLPPHGCHLPHSRVLHRLPPLLLSRVIKNKSRQYRAAQ